LFALIALVMTIGWLLWRSHRYLARQEEGWSPPVGDSRRQPHRADPPRNAPDDVIRWEVQMHDTARELYGQLDSKMGALAHLIREADRAAGRLEAALASIQRVPEQGPAAEAADGLPPHAPEEPAPLPARPTDQAEALKSAGTAGRASASREAAREADQPQRPPRERYEEIYLLSDYGLDAAEIAHRVGSPVGEVELILGLRGRQ
jgi:hypothetical protein